MARKILVCAWWLLLAMLQMNKIKLLPSTARTHSDYALAVFEVHSWIHCEEGVTKRVVQWLLIRMSH